ncbi:hypothetical protein EPN52_08110 [bacterium]|nr:MAG: hypothetical protein EPN52_08110 [bacterium]
MKHKLTVLIAGLAFVAGAAVPTLAVEHHPDMRAALNALFNARGHLQTSNHDFHGLRVKALEETNEAIHDVQAAIASDPG